MSTDAGAARLPLIVAESHLREVRETTTWYTSSSCETA